MKTNYRLSVRVVEHGYTGRVEVYEGKRYLWSESAQCVRMSRRDAKLDAHKLVDYIKGEVTK